MARRAPMVHDVMHLVAKAEPGQPRRRRPVARLRPTPDLLAALHVVAFGEPACGPACPCRR